MSALAPAPKKIRVFELAKTLGLETKAVLEHCRDLGFDVKNQLSSLESEQVDFLKGKIATGARPSAPAAPAPSKPAPLPKTEKKIHSLPSPKKVEAPVVDEEPVSLPPPEVEQAAPQVSEPIAEPVQPRAPVVELTGKVPRLQQVRPAPEPAPAVVIEEPIVAPAALEPDRTPTPDSIPEIAAQVDDAPPAPSRVQPLPGRPPALTPSRPANLGSPRPPASGQSANPRANPSPFIRPATGPGGPPRPPFSGSPATRPPSPPGTAAGPQSRGGPATQGGTRTGPGTGRGPAGPGSQQGPAGPGGDRHRRSSSQRTQSLTPRPATRTGPGAGPAPAPPPDAATGRKFTADEIKALRDGRSLHEVTRQREQPVAPARTDEGEDEESKKKGAAPGAKPGEKDRRAVERARRTEQRKVKVNSVVVQGGQVDTIEDTFGSRRGPRAALLKKSRRVLRGTVERKGKVPISLPITVRSLSEAIGMKVSELLFKLKDLASALFTINSTVETEVAELIASEKGVELDIQRQKTAEEALLDEHVEAAGDETKLESRAPIVTIMGHVDHGKTSLLDTIRKLYGHDSDVVSTEAGGITQVIRAWRVEKDGKPITFLDTPGHEAFTKMRARGANVTDIAVIVVAADSGVQPQTEEAVAHAKAAGVSIVVAINKMDMPGADPARVERQLYNLELLPDTMGGEVQFVRTSAVKGTGIAELLETLALVAEVKELKANPHKAAHGTCLEAYLSGDEGVMATMLVQQGTLHKGDIIVCGASYGRVRAMYDDLGRPIKVAGPSVPVRISGLNEVPNADDHFHAVPELVRARDIAEKRRVLQQDAAQARFSPVTLDKLGAAKNKIAELKVILKAEARGSVEAIRKELEKLIHDEVRVRVLHAGIGAITESDVQLALASPEDSMVVGFNVVPDDAALKLADERDIPIREYNIIYKLTEDIKAALEGKLKPEERVIHLGRAVVRQTFKISKVGTAAGAYVTQGVIERSAKIRVIRDGAVIYPQGEKVASLDSLKRFKDDVKDVKEGYDCGMKVANYDDIKVGDVIEAYRIEHVQRTL